MYMSMKTLDMQKLFGVFEAPPQERITRGMDMLALVSSLSRGDELSEPYRTQFCYAAFELLDELQEYNWRGEERVLTKFKRVLLDYFTEKEDYERCCILRDYKPLSKPSKSF